MAEDKSRNEPDARKLLLREYEYGHEFGRHWDLLRWSVSKFFLSIQTVFVIAALKGLLVLAETCNNTNKSLITLGLVVLAFINLILCLIWAIRNSGIYSWHRASIDRQKSIESDPKLKGTIAFFSTIVSSKGPPYKTGHLECWGPPIAFGLLWVGVIVLAVCFSNEKTDIKILILILVSFFALLSLFVARRLFYKKSGSTQKTTKDVEV